ncbi:MAG: tail fiber protein [Bacteroidota bacterium]
MKKITFLAMLLFALFGSLKSFSQDAYIGEIRMVGFNFEPKNWALCNGQLLSIASNTALFSILGTTYGGDGRTTFALPDLRGRAPMHHGQGPGLSTVYLGEMNGQSTVTLDVSQMPSHTHNVNAVTDEGNQSTPSGNLYANTKALDKEYSNASPNTTMNAQMIQPAGGNQPFNNMQPYNTVNYVICLYGIFPPRN